MRRLTSLVAALVLAVPAAAALASRPAAVAPAARAAAPAPLRIMALGDSITQGVGGYPVGNYSGYRTMLHQYLWEGARPAGQTWEWVGSIADQPRAPFRHEGHSGWTVQQIRAQIDGWLAAARPDVVLLHIGTNNILSEDPAITRAALQDLIARIRWHDADTRIYVARITQLGPTASADRHARARALADAVPQIVVDAGPRVYAVDMRMVGGSREAGADFDELLFDDRHPNWIGYVTMAYQWYEMLRNTLPGADSWATVDNPLKAETANICHRQGDTWSSCAVVPFDGSAR